MRPKFWILMHNLSKWLLKSLPKRASNLTEFPHPGRVSKREIKKKQGIYFWKLKYTPDVPFLSIFPQFFFIYKHSKSVYRLHKDTWLVNKSPFIFGRHKMEYEVRTYKKVFYHQAFLVYTPYLFASFFCISA